MWNLLEEGWVWLSEVSQLSGVGGVTRWHELWLGHFALSASAAVIYNQFTPFYTRSSTSKERSRDSSIGRYDCLWEGIYCWPDKDNSPSSSICFNDTQKTVSDAFSGSNLWNSLSVEITFENVIDKGYLVSTWRQIYRYSNFIKVLL